MTVLITKQNEPFFEKLGVKKFTPSTKNTSTFNVTISKFQKILSHVKSEGINPYALMVW